MLTAAAVWGELTFLCFAGWLLFLRRGYTMTEAAACAIISVLMLLSGVLQLGVLLDMRQPALGVEALLVLAAGGVAIVERRRMAPLWRNFYNALSGRWALTSALLVCLAYLAAQCFLIPPETRHWPALSSRLDRVPLNVSILPDLFLRFHTDYGVAGLGALGYLAILFATYALARRHAWPATALTVSLIVASMPRVVLQAATPGAEILPAAVYLFCILMVYRLIEQTGPFDFVMLVLGLLFSLSGGVLALLFSGVLSVLAFVLLLRRHAAPFWWAMVQGSHRMMLAALPPALLFSQTWQWLLHHRWGAAPPGVPDFPGIIYNAGGLPGALANSGRYLLESLDLTLPVDWACRYVLGFSPMGLVMGAYRATIGNLMGERGAAGAFSISWLPDPSLAWFGPLGFLLVIPAVLYASWRGPRRLKSIAVALIASFYLASLVPAWASGNARYFTPLFVCGGYLTAFLLPPWRLTKLRRTALQTLCLLLLAFSLVFNAAKPATSFRFTGAAETALTERDWGGRRLFPGDRVTGSAWIESDWGRDRGWRALRLFGDDRVERCAAALRRGDRVGVVSRVPWLSYPFEISSPGVAFQLLDPAALENPKRLEQLGLSHLLFVDTVSPAGAAIVWQARCEDARFPGALVMLPRF